MEEQLDLSVLIPAWNEAENLAVLLPQLRQTMGRLGISGELLVVDGGSRDETRGVAERAGARVILQTEPGYGGALLAGFASVRGRYVMTMDADLSHPPGFMEEFWRQRDSASVIIASRYVDGGKADMDRFRYVLSRILNFTFAKVFWIPLRDLSSGFRLYRREVVQQLSLASRDFDVLEEILVKLYRQGWRIREVPFHYLPRGAGVSKARVLKFGRAYVKTILRLQLQRRTPAKNASGSGIPALDGDR